MNRAFRFTALTRPLDFSCGTNAAIVLFSAATVFGVLLWRLLAGAALLPALLSGMGAGAAVFLAWALGREIDPDVPASALIAAGLALPGRVFLGPSDLPAVLWLLMGARLLNRSSGPTPTVLDSAGVLALAGWLALTDSWVYGAAAAAVFLLDGLLRPPNRKQLAFAVPALAFLVLSVLYREMLILHGPPGLWVSLIVLGVALLFFRVILTSGRIRATADRSGAPLPPARVRAAQSTALAAALLLAGWRGLTGIEELMPVWAALAGAGLARPFARAARR